MNDRQTRLPKDEPPRSRRPVFGLDIPCKFCKGRGTKFDAKKNENYTCYGCNGTGYRREE